METETDTEYFETTEIIAKKFSDIKKNSRDDNLSMLDFPSFLQLVNFTYFCSS